MQLGRSVIFVSLVVVAAAACGDDSSTPVDAGVDGPAVIRFTGEYIDWDSIPPNDQTGIFNAELKVRGGAMPTAVTAPNGRFDLMMPNEPFTVFDITPDPTPDDETLPYIGGVGVVAAETAPTAEYRIRSFRAARAAELGFDATKGHVYVHVIDGTTEAVGVGATSAAAVAFDGDSWEPGATGTDIYFPNVEVGAGTTTVTVPGATLVPDDVPVVAGKITYVVVQGG